MATPPDKLDMTLAFAYEAAKQIVRSDGHTKPAELAALSARFPRRLLEERGLYADGEPTARYLEAYAAAGLNLPALLSDAEKLDIARVLFDVCSADDAIERGEIEAVVRTMQALGTSKADLAEFLRRRVAARG
jgi:uncharacterized tellurite resistance protein B-like protein